MKDFIARRRYSTGIRVSANSLSKQTARRGGDLAIKKLVDRKGGRQTASRKSKLLKECGRTGKKQQHGKGKRDQQEGRKVPVRTLRYFRDSNDRTYRRSLGENQS